MAGKERGEKNLGRTNPFANLRRGAKNNEDKIQN